MDDFFRTNLDFSKYKQWRSVYYSLKREVHFAVTGIGTTDNNYRIVFDMLPPNIVRFRYSTRDTPVSMWLREVSGKPTLVMGEDDGFIYTLDQSARNKNSAAYNAVFQTPHLDMSHLDIMMGVRRKNFHFLEILAEPTGNFDLDCEIYYDGILKQNISFNLAGVSGVGLGTFVLGTSKLGSSNIIVRKRRLVGGGRRISVKGKNTGANEDFSLARMFVHFHVGDEKWVGTSN
jgi:hypothetical protein